METILYYNDTYHVNNNDSIFLKNRREVLIMFKDYLFAMRVLFGIFVAFYSIYLIILFFCKNNVQWIILNTILPMAINVFLVIMSTFFGMVPFRVILLICIFINFVHMILSVLWDMRKESPEGISYLCPHFLITVLEIIVMILTFLC